MKRILSVFMVWAALAGMTMAQVWNDYEAEDLGVDFSIPGWSGGAITAVGWAPDPTGASVGVMDIAVAFSSATTSGTLEKCCTFDAENAKLLMYYFWLPDGTPDDLEIKLWSQDASNWGWVDQVYKAGDLPKEKWVPLSWDMERIAATVGNYDPYTHKIGKIGIQLNYGGDFSGHLYVDNISKIGINPIVWNDYEVQDRGVDFSIPGWSGGAITDVYWAADPTGRSAGVMAIDVIASSAASSGTIEKCCTFDAEDADVIGYYFYLPGDIPDDFEIKLWSQDAGNWAWVDKAYRAGELPKGKWVLLTWDMRRVAVTVGNYDPYTHKIGKVGIQLNYGGDFAGTLLVDDLLKLGPFAAGPPVELESPSISVEGGVDTVVDPFTGEPLYHNVIRWTDLAANKNETYSLYYSESGKITDVNAAGVIQISKNIPRGVQVYYHRIYTVDGAEKTVWYAMTTTGVEGGKVVEKPIRDGISNSGPITAKTSKLYEIPLVNEFPFAPDGYLDEFEKLAERFTRMTLRNEEAAGDEAPLWTPESTDLNFKGYVVFDAANMYVGMEVVDDYPYGNGQAWMGDGFDLFGGLYDVRPLKSLWRGDDCQTGGTLGGGYRFGPAINENPNGLEISGYNPWVSPAGLEYAQDIYEGGYTVEFKIPFSTLNAQFNASFSPTDGMILPFKIDVNDNDATDPANNARTMQNHFGDVPGNFQGWMRAEAWSAPMIVTRNPISSVVATRDETLPTRFALEKNYPNPFNPGTTIRYLLPKATEVSIEVYDLLGKKVRTLVNGRAEAGSHLTIWDGTSDTGQPVATGIYFCKMVTPEFKQIRKLTLVR